MSNPFSSWAYGGEAGASVFGALPITSSGSPSSDFASYYFTCLNPTILNSTLTGPNGQPQLYMTTDSSLPGYTVFKTVDGRSVALIEWSQRYTQIEIRGVVQKQPASHFLTITPPCIT